jgi:hypothetical protein
MEVLPTGKLLDQGKAPFAGEIGNRAGMSRAGINQISVSVIGEGPVQKAVGYARSYGRVSCRPLELKNYTTTFEKTIQQLKELNPIADRWDGIIVTLLRIKQIKPEAFSALVKKHTHEIQEAIDTGMPKVLAGEKEILAALDYPQEELTKISNGDDEALSRLIQRFPTLNEQKIVQPRDDDLIGVFVTDDLLNSSIFERDVSRLVRQIFLIRLYPDRIPSSSGWASEIYNVRLMQGFIGGRVSRESFFEGTIRRLVESRIRALVPLAQKRMERLMRAIYEPPSVFLNDHERLFIEQGFSVVIGSTKTPCCEAETGREGLISEGKIGDDIDLIAVEDKYVPVVLAWVNNNTQGSNIHIISLSQFELNIQSLVPGRMIGSHHRMQQYEFVNLDLEVCLQVKKLERSEELNHRIAKAACTALFAVAWGEVATDFHSSLCERALQVFNRTMDGENVDVEPPQPFPEHAEGLKREIRDFTALTERPDIRQVLDQSSFPLRVLIQIVHSQVFRQFPILNGLTRRASNLVVPGLYELPVSLRS